MSDRSAARRTRAPWARQLAVAIVTLVPLVPLVVGETPARAGSTSSAPEVAAVVDANAAAPTGKTGRPPKRVSERDRKRSRRRSAPRMIPPAHSLAPDDSRLPRTGHPHVLGRQRPTPRMRGSEPAPLLGWSASLAAPRFKDRTRRPPLGKRPPPLGGTLRAGERFRFDVFFSGNPTGMAEAGVVSREPDPNGGPPLLKLHGFARTSGVVALLTTISYELDNYVDAETGAPVLTHAEIKRDGLTGKYKRRVTDTAFLGRGYVEIRDRKDEREAQYERTIPVDTYDSLSIMAWVRALSLDTGASAKAYALDGKTLLRVDITSRGRGRLENMPTIGTALGIRPDQVYELEGTITRVDRYGAAIPGKRTYEMRVWISDDDRRIPLVLESDMWLGVVRLNLTQYDPPHEQADPGGGVTPAGPRRPEPPTNTSPPPPTP